MATSVAVSPKDEVAQIRGQIADMHREVQRLAATPGYSPIQVQQFTTHARQWVQSAEQRVAVLMRQGAGIPGQALTPAAATKAVRKANRKAKKQAKREAQLKRMAESAINQLAPDNPLVGTARTLMNEQADKDTRKSALNALVSALPVGSNIHPIAKAMGVEIAVDMFGDDDDDDDDE